MSVAGRVSCGRGLVVASIPCCVWQVVYKERSAAHPQWHEDQWTYAMAELAVKGRIAAQLVLDFPAMAACFVECVEVAIGVVDLVRRSLLPLVFLRVRLPMHLLLSVAHCRTDGGNESVMSWNRGGSKGCSKSGSCLDASAQRCCEKTCIDCGLQKRARHE